MSSSRVRKISCSIRSLFSSLLEELEVLLDMVAANRLWGCCQIYISVTDSSAGNRPQLKRADCNLLAPLAHAPRNLRASLAHIWGHLWGGFFAGITCGAAFGGAALYGAAVARPEPRVGENVERDGSRICLISFAFGRVWGFCFPQFSNVLVCNFQFPCPHSLICLLLVYTIVVTAPATGAIALPPPHLKFHRVSLQPCLFHSRLIIPLSSDTLSHVFRTSLSDCASGFRNRDPIPSRYCALRQCLNAKFRRCPPVAQLGCAIAVFGHLSDNVPGLYAGSLLSSGVEKIKTDVRHSKQRVCLHGMLTTRPTPNGDCRYLHCRLENTDTTGPLFNPSEATPLLTEPS